VKSTHQILLNPLTVALLVVGVVGLSTTGCLSGDGFSDIFPEDACGRIPKPRDQAIELGTSLEPLPMFQVHGTLVRSAGDACFSKAQIELRQDEDCELSISLVVDREDPSRLVADEAELFASADVCVAFPGDLRGRYEASEATIDAGEIWVEGLPTTDTINTGCRRETLTLHLGGEMQGVTTGKGAATSFDFDAVNYELEVPLDASLREGSCGD